MKKSFWREFRRFCRDPVWLFMIWLAAVSSILAALFMDFVTTEMRPYSTVLLLAGIAAAAWGLWASTYKPD